MSDPPDSFSAERRQQPLGQCVRSSLRLYFEKLEGHPAANLYELVLEEVERPLFELVLKRSAGNITKAAGILGVNRATLRKRLKRFGLLTKSRG
ncbi:MAG: helix-turn-helix domain-containing protein [Gammaproteobacteria bacterium]